MPLPSTNLSEFSGFHLRGGVLAAWHGYFVMTVREVVYYDQTVKFDPARLGGLVFANKSA